MIAHLYLSSDSLQYNGTDSEEDVLKKLNAFVEDLKYIDKYRAWNKILVNWNIFDMNISETKGLFQMIEELERDRKNLLQNILYNSSNTTDLDFDDICKQCKVHTQNECSAIIAFNNIDDLNKDMVIVYDKTTWFAFRRNFLGLYPQNSDYFIDECGKYFDNLFFHANNRNTVGNYLEDFSIKIVKYLSDLNDHFKDFYERNKGVNTNETLKKFSLTYNHDEVASLQGNHDRKDELTFNFRYYNKETKESRIEQLYCEPHLKISRSDKHPKDPTEHCVRIYFHFGMKYVEDERILIGSIGPHVK